MDRRERFGATDGDIRRAHQNAEAFAKHKSKEFAEQFYKDSGIFDSLYAQYKKDHPTNVAPMSEEKFLEHLINDNEFIFGKILAISYALAYIDGKQGKTVSELIVGFNKPIKRPSLIPV